MWTDEVTFTLRTGCYRAPDLPCSDALDMAVQRARGCRSHALYENDLGSAIIAELAWQAQRPGWLRMMGRYGWIADDAEAELAFRERHYDALCRHILDEEPGLSLNGLLARLLD